MTKGVGMSVMMLVGVALRKLLLSFLQLAYYHVELDVLTKYFFLTVR